MLENTKNLDWHLKFSTLTLMLSKEEESILVRQTKGGSQEAFIKLEEDCRAKVWASLLKLVKNEHTAEDIYQQGLSKAWKKIKKFKGEARFSTWLYRICHNLAYDKFRKDSRDRTDSLELLSEVNPNGAESLFLKPRLIEENGFRNIDMSELGERLDKTLAKLSPEHKEVLELYAREDLSYEQISQKTEVPVGTVMSRLYYARKRARKQYEKLVKNEA
tara:strand:- start:8692 stop:9345 length:654 start_codon:yes stop_codon:yes gene_type:complete